MKGCDLVLVEWEDSRQPTSHWQRLCELELEGICKCVSVGFLVHDGEDKKVLAPNMADIEDEHNIQASGLINIPASAVTKMVCLEEATCASSGLAAV